MTITVPKIGSGTPDDGYRPDTTAGVWCYVTETKDTYTIEIEEGGVTDGSTEQ